MLTNHGHDATTKIRAIILATLGENSLLRLKPTAGANRTKKGK